MAVSYKIGQLGMKNSTSNNTKYFPADENLFMFLRVSNLLFRVKQALK